MKKVKTTKRALLSSVLALLLCMSMFVGTTFAWFTDSVTSANNIITSGNLDIELEYLKDGAWVDVEGASDIITNELFEPGVTEVAYLRVRNAGSLALKYQLGINIVNEVVGKNVKGEDLKLSDHIMFGVIDNVNGETGAYADRESAVAAVTTPAKISTGYVNGAAMDPNEELYLALVVYMPTSVGNEANHDGKNVPQIDLGINVIATQMTAEEDSFDDQYDANAIIAASAAEAQAALDAADAKTTVYLVPGVNYGTLYLRPVAGQTNTVTDCDYLVYRNEMLRKVEDLTIVGAPGATVEAIVTESGYVKDSGSTGYVVDIQNLVIDSVEFNDTHTNAPHSYASPMFFDLSYINVNGLTVKNCKLIGNNNKMNFVYFYGSGNPDNSTFETAAKNITISGNTVDGIARLCELRQAENVTITNNMIKNTALHGILLPVDGGTYSGNVTITGNTADKINERFVRMAGAGAATVTVTDNTITNYLGADEDHIKITDSTGTLTVANNSVTKAYVATTSDEVRAVLAQDISGVTVFLKAGTYEGLSFTNPASFKATDLTIVGEAGVVVNGFAVNGWSVDNNIVVDGLTIKNVTFTSGLLLSTKSMSNVTVEDCVFTNDAAVHQNDKTEKLTGLTVKNCTFTGDKNGTATAIMLENTEALTVTGCTFTDIDFNVLQAGIITGKVLFDGNTVNGTGDRVFRFVTITGADITISNNVINSAGDGAGELAKSTDPCQITLTNNKWNGLSDAEVANKLINITAK